MTPSRALATSIAVTLALTAVLSFLFGGKVLGMFLLLPLGFLLRHRQKPSKDDQPQYRSAEPIEPK